MINLFKPASIPTPSQTPNLPTACVICLSGCSLLFAEEPPLLVLCIQQCLENYCS
jgi:hypothetical protein